MIAVEKVWQTTSPCVTDAGNPSEPWGFTTARRSRMFAPRRTLCFARTTQQQAERAAAGNVSRPLRPHHQHHHPVQHTSGTVSLAHKPPIHTTATTSTPLHMQRQAAGASDRNISRPLRSHHQHHHTYQHTSDTVSLTHKHPMHTTPTASAPVHTRHFNQTKPIYFPTSTPGLHHHCCPMDFVGVFRR